MLFFVKKKQTKNKQIFQFLLFGPQYDQKQN